MKFWRPAAEMAHQILQEVIVGELTRIADLKEGRYD